MKLDLYREFIFALSGAVSGRASREVRFRYADAVNSLFLVADGNVLVALKKYQNEMDRFSREKSQTLHGELLDKLVKAMRKDICGRGLAKKCDISFRLMAPPSE